MARWNVTFTNLETGEELTLPALEVARWDALDKAEGLPDSPSKSLKGDHLWAYYSARECGRLAELGVDEGTDPLDAIRAIARRWDVDLHRAKDGEVPFVSAPES